MNIYEQNGYTSRKHYLTSMAEDYGIEEEIVFELAKILGESEDFDGLVSMLEDQY